MPLFDRRCSSCGWFKADCIERAADRERACPACGAATAREWNSPPAMIPDTYETPVVDTVMDKEPHVWTSRSQHRDAMRARGIVEGVQHLGSPGSDKSKHTTRWW